ncbi:unnamed protein product [Darwinula stevensoni]|uniref:Secreted protein n=1 Tax=Darwinula stevensoni TaxID=69355 RepID=A0A7R9AIE7_9CRUS|nr:unnamed protein product [Darwinula stevensoni]CAG0905872.1 unnamed protein product [Darwinula stevensoni]
MMFSLPFAVVVSASFLLTARLALAPGSGEAASRPRIRRHAIAYAEADTDAEAEAEADPLFSDPPGGRWRKHKYGAHRVTVGRLGVRLRALGRRR